MYSIYNRDDLEKLKKLQETKSLLHKERIKEKLGKQDFHYDMEEVFEPVTENQTKHQELSEKQIQALRDSTQTTTQAIENQTRAIEHSSDILNKNLQKSIKEGIQEYDEITNRNNQLLTIFVNSNQVDSSIIKTVSNLFNTKSQFSSEPIEGYPNSLTINPNNPQQVLIKGSTMTFENGHSYDLSDPDLQYFITNTQFDGEINNLDTIYSFLIDIKYNINYGDKKSTRYYFIEELYSRFHWGTTVDNNQLQGFTESGLHTQDSTRSYAQGSTQQFIFLPSDPNELVDQLKLLYFEKVG